jgi:hypothetical protein
MALPEPPAYPQAEFEALIAALHDVMACSVVLDGASRIAEIHVLAGAGTHPKQIVRNIESALSAGLGVVVDRRIISVAQVRPEHDALVRDALSGAGNGPAELESPAGEEEETNGRFIFVGYDARTQPDTEAACRVSIRLGNVAYSGTGNGPGTTLGRAQSAARAVFAALDTAHRGSPLGLEGVTLVESHGRAFVLVAANVSIGRNAVPLTGIAAMHKSPEEAAILAALQATNRWNELDG